MSVLSGTSGERTRASFGVQLSKRGVYSLLIFILETPPKVMVALFLLIITGIIEINTTNKTRAMPVEKGCTTVPLGVSLVNVLHSYLSRTDSNSNHMGVGNYGICSDDCLTVENPPCFTVSGPANGSQCVFPFILGDQNFTACAEWNFGGENQGRMFCSTK